MKHINTNTQIIDYFFKLNIRRTENAEIKIQCQFEENLIDT